MIYNLLTVALGLIALLGIGTVMYQRRQLARLSHRFSRHVDEESALHQLATALTGATTTQDYARRVVRYAVRRLGAEGSFLELVSNGEVSTVAAAGSADQLAGMSSPMDRSITGIAMDSRGPISLNSLLESSSDVAPHLLRACGDWSLTAVQLPGREGPLGALVFLRPKGRSTEASDATRIQRLADLVAVGVRRVMLLESLKESEQRFRLIAENLREAVWISDPEYQKHYYVSPAYADIFGSTASEALKNPRAFIDVVHPDDRAEVTASLEDYSRGAYDVEYRVISGGPEERWVSARAYPVRDESGAAYRVVGIAEDITEQKRSEEEREFLLRREQHALVETKTALRVRDRVLRIVSHDLKNPLHTIGMASQLLELPISSEEQSKQIEIINRTVGRATRMVNDLLDAARLQAGQGLAIQPAAVRVEALLDELSESFRTQVSARHQRLSIDISGAVDQIRADRDRLFQALENLVGNAVKFTPEGGHIGLRVEQPSASEVLFEIEDTGRGIADDLIPHLFEPFSQATDTATLGSGLGLAIAQGIVEAHGGTISVESRAGEGTKFSIHLPTNAPGDAGPTTYVGTARAAEPTDEG